MLGGLAHSAALCGVPKAPTAAANKHSTKYASQCSPHVLHLTTVPSLPRLVSLPQVNPLAESADGKLIAADAKLGFDDNAAYRQKEIFDMKDESQIDPR